MSRESELNYEKRIMSYVRNLMVGQFKSTVVCSFCKKISVCFDPFLLISLPIPTKDEMEIFFVPFDFKRGAIKFTIQFNRTTTLKKVSEELV
jgi:ubiquitin C-terminal hydrolase